jgi:hypothetical protein
MATWVDYKALQQRVRIHDGSVNLFALMQQPDAGEASRLLLPSGGQGWSCDLPPHLESFLQLLALDRRGKSTTAQAEVLEDGLRGGEERV